MEQNPVVLFDGVCNFCNGIVNWLLRRDRTGRLRFASLQSNKGAAFLQQYGLSQTAFSSFVLIENDQAFTRSTAALKLLSYLPWYYAPLRAGWLLPRPLRNALYDFVARNRYRWFGKREQCMLPTKDQRRRFLDGV